MRTRIQKWGNSLAMRIPRSFAQDTGLAEGVTVDMTVEAGEIRVRAIRPKYDLRELVAAINSRNQHSEIDAGEPRGKEAW
jgi:antitoxin MazE